MNISINIPIWHKFEKRKMHKESKLQKYTKLQHNNNKKKHHKIIINKKRYGKYFEQNDDVLQKLFTKEYFIIRDWYSHWAQINNHLTGKKNHNLLDNLVKHIKKLAKTSNCVQLEKILNKYEKILRKNNYNYHIINILYEYGLYKYIPNLIKKNTLQSKNICDIIINYSNNYSHYDLNISYFRFATRETQLQFLSKKENIILLFEKDPVYVQKFIIEHKIYNIFKLISEKYYEYYENNQYNIHTKYYNQYNIYTKCYSIMNDVVNCIEHICNYDTPKKYISKMYLFLYNLPYSEYGHKYLYKLKYLYCDYYKYYTLGQIKQLEFHNIISITVKCVYIILKHVHKFIKKTLCKLIFHYLIK